MSESLLIELYEKIATESARMLAAARAADWDGLVTAENDCASVVERLRAAPGAPTLSEPGQRRKAEIIRRVLQEDAEIRSRVEPWLAELGNLIGTSRRAEVSAQVSASYGS